MQCLPLVAAEKEKKPNAESEEGHEFGEVSKKRLFGVEAGAGKSRDLEPHEPLAWSALEGRAVKEDVVEGNGDEPHRLETDGQDEIGDPEKTCKDDAVEEIGEDSIAEISIG